jgi:toxin ParE1/3/4
MEVRYRPKARADLQSIWAAIAMENPVAADRFVRRVVHRLELAATQPLMGSPRPELSKRARVLIEGSYIIIYVPAKDAIDVLAIVHGRRDSSNWLDG